MQKNEKHVQLYTVDVSRILRRRIVIFFNSSNIHTITFLTPHQIKITGFGINLKNNTSRSNTRARELGSSKGEVSLGIVEGEKLNASFAFIFICLLSSYIYEI